MFGVGCAKPCSDDATVVDMFTAELDDRVGPDELFHAERTRIVKRSAFDIFKHDRRRNNRNRKKRLRGGGSLFFALPRRFDANNYGANSHGGIQHRISSGAAYSPVSDNQSIN